MSRAPLAGVGAIKLKLGALLGGAVVVTALVVIGTLALGLPPVLGAALAVAIGLVAVEVLGSGLTAPLRQMARQADRLADGHPVDPVDDTARDEVGDLARAFNRMAVEVAHTDRVRRELVANVSHELRTPLAALTAQVENLVDGVEEAGPAQLAVVEAQVRRLRGLVDDLLDLSQLDAGAADLDRVPTRLAALVDEAVAACGEDARDRVTVEVADEVAVVPLDPTRFLQVLTNLVGNALRHGPPGTPVTVTAVGDDAGVLRLTVADDGPGIAPADAERVFSRFVRTDEGRATDTGGAGLGLAITRWIVELHGGTVVVDRPGEPGGRLTVELPVAPSDAPPPPPAVPATGGTATAPPPPPPSGDVARDPLRLLPTPVAGLSARTLLAMAAAATLAVLLGGAPLRDGPGLGVTVLLLGGAAATLVALERRLDAFGTAACAIAVGVALAWTVTDAWWTLMPVTFGAVLLAGLGIWGPHRFGEAWRALVVGPLLALVAPVAAARGLRSQRSEQVARFVVPAVGTLLVLVVFGSLLGDADALFGRALDAVVPDVRLDAGLVGRLLFGGFVALVVATYVLVQRAGAVPTTPWSRPVRPRSDWLVPLVALDVLVGAFVALQLGVLFGGREQVLTTAGLTYAEYARQGFGQLLVTALLTLGVIAVVVRVAADEDRAWRDRLLGLLLVLTGVVLASAVLRLQLYAEAFGFTQARATAFVVLAWVGAVLVLVAVAGLSARFAPHLPRTAVLVTGVVALGFVLARPDALIAAANVERFEATGKLDVAYLQQLSADADLALATLPEEEAIEALFGTRLDVGEVEASCDLLDAGPVRWTGVNVSRTEARAARAELLGC